MPQYLNTFSEINTVNKISDKNPIKFEITSDFLIFYLSLLG